jgi:hypothetical protein
MLTKVLNNPNELPPKWPFPTYNNQRTAESQALLDQKVHTKTKTDVSDVEDALF